MFLKYKAKVEHQWDQKIKHLSIDRGGGYKTNSLTTFYEKNGIIHGISAPHTPQQNGTVKRQNRILK